MNETEKDAGESPGLKVSQTDSTKANCSVLAVQNGTSHPDHSVATNLDVASAALSELARTIEGCDWDQLQERFIDEMNQRSQVEKNLQKETADLLEVS